MTVSQPPAEMPPLSEGTLEPILNHLNGVLCTFSKTILEDTDHYVNQGFLFKELYNKVIFEFNSKISVSKEECLCFLLFNNKKMYYL